jgi:imidazolonepropionase-like amidohydrolase
MTRALYLAGVPLLAGTDFLAGFTYQRELELHAAAGIPAAAVLQYATLGSARVMKRDAELGSIRAGKLADMVLIDGAPATNISDIRRVVSVVKNGVLYSAPLLQESIGIRPRSTLGRN